MSVITVETTITYRSLMNKSKDDLATMVLQYADLNAALHDQIEHLPKWLNVIPPQNLECEQAVLGCILIAPETIETALKTLKMSDFYREAHGVIFAALCSLHRAGTPVDLLSVQEKLKSKEAPIHMQYREVCGKPDNMFECVGGMPYLVQLMDAVPCWQNIEYYCAVVKDKSLRRQWAEAFVEAASQMYASPDDFAGIWGECRGLVREVEKG